MGLYSIALITTALWYFPDRICLNAFLWGQEVEIRRTWEMGNEKKRGDVFCAGAESALIHGDAGVADGEELVAESDI